MDYTRSSSDFSSFKNKQQVQDREKRMQEAIDAFKIFDAIKEKEKQEKNAVSIPGETAVLRGQWLQNIYNFGVNKYGSGFYTERMAIDQMERMTKKPHECSWKCKFFVYKKGSGYEYDGKRYVSSGNVCMCPASGMVHVCGIQNCRYQVQANNGEGVECSLTGFFLGQKYILFGNDVGSSKTEEVFDEKEDCGSSQKRIVNKYNGQDENNVYWSSIVQKLSIDCGSQLDAEDVYEKYGNSKTYEELKKLVITRSKRRDIATKIFNMHIMNKHYVKILRDKYEKHNKEFVENIIPQYYMSCATNNKKVNLFNISILYMQNVWPSLEALRPGVDLEAENKEKSHYYIECILLLWESLEFLPDMKQFCFSFETTCVAILYYMSVGLEVELYVCKKTLKPHREIYLTEEEKKQCSVHRITIIPKHPKLTLAKVNDVLSLHSKKHANSSSAKRKFRAQNNKSVGRRKKRKKHVARSMHTMLSSKKKTAKGNSRKRAKTSSRTRYMLEQKDNEENDKRARNIERNNGRKTSDTPQCIRAINKLNTLYDMAIKTSPDIQTFVEMFCLGSLIEIQL